MVKDYPGEQWRILKFDIEYTNDFKMEISNFGRLRSFNAISNGNILNGSMINGYRILRIRLFRPREEKMQKDLYTLRGQVLRLTKQIKTYREDSENKKLIEETSNRLAEVKKTLARKMKLDNKQRSVYYQSLIHRLVATYFLKKPAQAQTIVSHLDYNKLNNRAGNLKWMSLEENYTHQRNNPQVIAEKNDWTLRKRQSPTTKLTVTKVMLLKKLLNQNKPVRQLAKQFKVTDTQIIRIRKGENWGHIDAAK